MILAAVAVLGIVVGTATTLSSQVKRVEDEAELLYRGMTIRNAIRSYYRVNGKYPIALAELVHDSAHPEKHHLRALYRDPMSPISPESESGGWVLQRDTGGGIRGVTSSSQLEPRKKANFPKGFEKFEGAASYAQWIFEYVPETKPILTPPGTGVPVGPPVRSIN